MKGDVKGTTKFGFRLGGVHTDVIGYCDADFAGDLDTEVYNFV
jgi:hypothetical protein